MLQSTLGSGNTLTTTAPATGDSITAQFHDEVPSNNVGSLTLEILELK